MRFEPLQATSRITTRPHIHFFGEQIYSSQASKTFETGFVSASFWLNWNRLLGVVHLSVNYLAGKVWCQNLVFRIFLSSEKRKTGILEIQREKKSWKRDCRNSTIEVLYSVELRYQFWLAVATAKLCYISSTEWDLFPEKKSPLRTNLIVCLDSKVP